MTVDPPAPPGSRGPLVTAAALLTAWALLFAPALLTEGQFLFRDAGRMHHPVKRWLAAELRRGHLPEWNPFGGLGVPVVAGAVDAPLHPLNALFVLLPFEAAFKGFILLSVLAAGLGAAAWGRRLGLGTPGAAAAGLAFLLSGFVVSSTDNPTYLATLAAAPWFLTAAHAASARGGPGRLLLVALASFVMAAGGDPMGWGVAVGLSALQAPLVATGVPLTRRILRAGGLCAVALLAAAPVLLPVLLWIPQSSRGADFAAGEYERWNLHPLRLLELVVPHLMRGKTGSVYVGVHHVYAGNAYTTVPWVLSLYAGAASVALAVLGARRNRRALLLAVGAVLFAWMAMGPNAGFGQLARHLPLLSSLRFWEKLGVWITLLLAVAAGFGVEALLAAPRSGRRLALVAGGFGAALLACGGLATAFERPLALLIELGGRRAVAEAMVQNLQDGCQAAGLALALLALVAWLLSAGRLARLGPAALLLVLALDLLSANLRAYFLMDPALVSEPAPLTARLTAEPGLARVMTVYEISADRWPELTQVENGWRWTARTAGEAWNVPLRFGNFEAYTGMLPRRYSAFRARVPKARLVSPAALWGFQFVVVPQRLELARLVDLRPPHDLVAEDPGLPAFLLRRPARPRAYLAAGLTSVDEAGALAFVASPEAAAGDRSVVEGPLPAGYSPPLGEARLLADEGERVELTATSNGPALLILNDALVDGWAATVDGAPAAMVPANYLARGVWLTAGTHRVQFHYRTPGLDAGLWIAAALAAALVAWAALTRRRS